MERELEIEFRRKFGGGKAKIGLAVCAVMVVILVISNVLVYTNLQNRIDAIEIENTNLQGQMDTLEAENSGLEIQWNRYPYSIFDIFRFWSLHFNNYNPRRFLSFYGF